MDRYEWVRRVESNARTYAATFESVFEVGSGLRLKDSTGRDILDCLCCAGALPLGHNHPEVKSAVVEFIDSGHVQQVLDLITPAKYDFIEQLYGVLPPAFAAQSKIHFCSPSGSDAVEAAMKLTRIATQRQPIIAFHGAYHGMTGAALGAMGNLGPKSRGMSAGQNVHFAPYPYTFRCPFGSDGSQTDKLSLAYLDTILSDPESGVPCPAAVIVEVVQGEGGCIPVSDYWLRSLRELTKHYQIPLIVDEVQSGFGRTGTMFAFERAGIVPDVLVLSKALGGGFPLAVVMYHESLDVWSRGMHAGTFRGNQIAMVSGKKTMEIIQRDHLAANARSQGEGLVAGLRDLAQTYPELGDVRGRGLMVGVEVVKPGATTGASEPDGELATRIKLAAFEHGLLIETGGRHGAVMRFLPPLNISESDVGEILSRFESALTSTVRRKELSYVA
ncbi:diaminobutyrate--2-oxoglutarate transaminase family protein [Denitromonas iodatirespirans]|uniref:Diaminobutyrate--2-oxoglutarate transaminase family protein n=1 Tax=Denitromonas iodatirespirans TaxID=2795389 RepID=A0A944DFE0_DENI1|nr:diaminobutyrate--2-oxoglutarate transaminase family protein [Denitromonas iodatirespirans]MBT0963976.1 diaminobutyrate--2-oxoglutarate transaminase family protein [Denitromonas iodatirespirans]